MRIPQPSPQIVSTRFAKKWKKLPKGWTEESVKKFWENLTSGAPKHKVTECIKQMEGKFDNPGAFCGGLADWMIPGWRQEVAKERRKKGGSSPLSLRPDYGSEPEDYEEDMGAVQDTRRCASPLGKKVYLDRDQCELFDVDYNKKGDELVVAADELLRSGGNRYDEVHQKILKPLRSRVISATNVGYGWFRINQIF